MRHILTLIFLFLFNISHAQISITSWNIRHFGKSKTTENIEFIAKILKDSDIVAIQEVVAGYGGIQAVARLADELNRTGNKWDYIISDPTNSTPNKSERYAYLWKIKNIKISRKGFLDSFFEEEIEREPYMLYLEHKGNKFLLVNFHAIPKKQQPEREIKYFKFFPEKYKTDNIIFLGDFNCPERHSVFNPLKKQGYIPAFVGQKTSLRQKCINGDCLASEYDNFFLHGNYIKLIESKATHFYEHFEIHKDAQKISDHIPITIVIDFYK